MRFYVITIVAIFMALGIGIFIGLNLNGQDMLLQQQQQIVQGLEGRFSEIMVEKENFSEQINALAVENERNSSFLDILRDAIASDRLQQESIAMVATNEEYYYSDVKEIIERAGGSLSIQLIYTDKLLNIDNKRLMELNSFYGYNILSKNELYSIVNHYIVDAIIYSEVSSFLNNMIKEDYIRLKGNFEELQGGIDKIILAGGGINQDKDKMKVIDQDIVERIGVYRRKIVAVERLDVGFSYIPFYKTLGLSTVDNVNTSPGQIALVLLLQGAEGHYGEKSTSDGLVPIFLHEGRLMTNE